MKTIILYSLVLWLALAIALPLLRAFHAVGWSWRVCFAPLAVSFVLVTLIDFFIKLAKWLQLP